MIGQTYKGGEEMYFVLDERKLKEQRGSWLPLLLHSTFIKMSLFVLYTGFDGVEIHGARTLILRQMLLHYAGICFKLVVDPCNAWK